MWASGIALVGAPSRTRSGERLCEKANESPKPGRLGCFHVSLHQRADGYWESPNLMPVGGLQEAADAFLVGRSVHNPTFLERFTDGWLGNYRDLEIIACSLLYSPLGDGCHCRLLSFCDGDLLAVCMNNSRDLGEPLTERSRGIGTIFRQAN